MRQGADGIFTPDSLHPKTNIPRTGHRKRLCMERRLHTGGREADDARSRRCTKLEAARDAGGLRRRPIETDIFKLITTVEPGNNHLRMALGMVLDGEVE